MVRPGPSCSHLTKSTHHEPLSGIASRCDAHEVHACLGGIRSAAGTWRHSRGVPACSMHGGKDNRFLYDPTRIASMTRSESAARTAAVSRTRASAQKRAFPSSTMHVILVTAAAMTLLTRNAVCYSSPPAPHHFFSSGAGSSGPAATSKIPAPGQLARPREGVVLKGGKVL